MVIILLVVAPVLASMLNQINQTLFPEPGRTTTGVPTYSPPPMSGNTGAPGRYTPGPPDLDPNEPPSPRTYDEIHEMLERNPLYAQALVPTDCTVTTIDLVHGSTSEIEEYMNQFIGCLMSAWYGPVVDAGFELPRPSVTVYTSEITSACGELPMYNAVYCTADQQIYYARDLIEALPNDLRNARFLAESIIAHEFGHTLQYRTMILMSEAIMEVDAASDSEKFDLSRRLEMQADCFAGLFLNSVTESTQLSADDEHNIIAAFTALGGTTPYDDDHGTGANRAYWTAQGLESTLPGICGTFLAPAHQVS